MISIEKLPKVETFYKAAKIIEGLAAKNRVIEKKFFSYDTEFGIYSVLHNVLYSGLTPQIVLDEYPEINGDKVPAFANELYVKGLFNIDVLSKIRAEDGDTKFFNYIKTAAKFHLYDRYRAIQRSVISKLSSIDEAYELTSTDALIQNFEDRDTLDSIIENAKLNKLQMAIIDYDTKGYSPKEIAEKTGLSTNVCSIKKTRTTNRLKELASKKYEWS